MWNISEKNDGSSNNVGNGWLQINFHEDLHKFKQHFKLNFKQLLIYKLNEVFKIGEEDGLPEPGTPFTYNFNCGPIIGSTKFKDSINLYSDHGSTDMNEVNFNLLPRFMQIDESSVKYYHDYFMLRCKNITYANTLINTEMFTCPVSILAGFPSVVMTLDSSLKSFEFSFKDFFLFPTIKNYTVAS